MFASDFPGDRKSNSSKKWVVKGPDSLDIKSRFTLDIPSALAYHSLSSKQVLSACN
jgi:hypothetical protein